VSLLAAEGCMERPRKVRVEELIDCRAGGKRAGVYSCLRLYGEASPYSYIRVHACKS
jgi:hypothetical protein